MLSFIETANSILPIYLMVTTVFLMACCAVIMSRHYQSKLQKCFAVSVGLAMGILALLGGMLSVDQLMVSNPPIPHEVQSLGFSDAQEGILYVVFVRVNNGVPYRAGPMLKAKDLSATQKPKTAIKPSSKTPIIVRGSPG
ncbi:hypothetical protein GOV04_02180 [Candidatus Woesearchaeota archaeon]|nr:hypothetical protein [Candidatus Woesearchaeota archaeon]